MAGIIYGLCAFTAFVCSWLLLQAYRRSRYRLLLWGGLCFVMLTLNNILVILDELIIHSMDFSTWRLVTGFAGMLILLYGLIWEDE